MDPIEKQAENRIASERKFWNSKAQAYDRLVNRFFPKIYETILANLVQDTYTSQNLLEAAAGTGILTIKLSDQVANITAIDIAPEMIEVAREKSVREKKTNIDFRIGDICNLEFKDKSFDTVVASNVLHLLFHPEVALMEMRRVLDDNGQIIIPTFCHGANLRSHVLSKILALLGQKPRNSWSPGSFTEFVEHYGFQVDKRIYINDKIPLLYVVAVKK